MVVNIHLLNGTLIPLEKVKKEDIEKLKNWIEQDDDAVIFIPSKEMDFYARAGAILAIDIEK